MTLSSIGDLSLNQMLRARSSASKSEIATLSQELATGLTQNKARAVRYDFGALSGIERSIAMAESYRTSAAEAALFVTAAQSAMEIIHTQVGDLANTLALTSNSGTQIAIDATIAESKMQLKSSISALNQSVAGRSLFAGANTEYPATANLQTFLDALTPIAGASATAEDWQANLDAWFAPGGDFETLGYTGSTTPLNGFLVGEGQRVEMNLTASDDVVRNTLKTLISVALLGETAFAADLTQQQATLGAATNSAFNTQAEITLKRAEIGAAQEAIDTAETQNATEKAGLEIARNNLLAVDGYETATRFEEANRQLESLYMITARIARLNLSDFI